MENDKYVVFKRDEFNEWARVMHDAVEEVAEGKELNLRVHLNQISLQDAVVIRKQDVFAAPGLYGYAASIQTAIEVAQRLDPSSLTEEEQWRLEALRDFFFEQGHEAAEHSPKKIPD
jgi:hypothetical protein